MGGGARFDGMIMQRDYAMTSFSNADRHCRVSRACNLHTWYMRVSLETCRFVVLHARAAQSMRVNPSHLRARACVRTTGRWWTHLESRLELSDGARHTHTHSLTHTRIRDVCQMTVGELNTWGNPQMQNRERERRVVMDGWYKTGTED